MLNWGHNHVYRVVFCIFFTKEFTKSESNFRGRANLISHNVGQNNARTVIYHSKRVVWIIIFKEYNCLQVSLESRSAKVKRSHNLGHTKYWWHEHFWHWFFDPKSSKVFRKDKMQCQKLYQINWKPSFSITVRTITNVEKRKNDAPMKKSKFHKLF